MDDSVCNRLDSSEVMDDSVCNRSDSSEVMDDSVCNRLDSDSVCNRSDSEVMDDSVCNQTAVRVMDDSVCKRLDSSEVMDDSVCNRSDSSEVMDDSVCNRSDFSEVMDDSVCNRSDSSEVMDDSVCNRLDSSEVMDDSVCKRSDSSEVMDDSVCKRLDSSEVMDDSVCNRLDSSEVMDDSVYILQTIAVENQKLNIFFDSGCEDLVSKMEALPKLEEVGKASIVKPDPIVLGGIGNMKTQSSHGIYKVELTMADGNTDIMSGVCLDKVRAKFPTYPLNGKVREDIEEGYNIAGYNSDNLPKLPESVRGETDLIIDIKYLKYFPEVIFRLPSGLTIYESPFLSIDGTRGVVGGPHKVFTMIERHYCCDTFTSMGTYFVQQIMLARIRLI